MTTAAECPHFRIHLIELMQRIVSRIAEDTAADMAVAGFAVNDDDLDALAEFVHALVSDALAVGWATGVREVST